MKIVKLFILASMISLIFGKSDSKKASLSYSNLKKDDVIENFTDNPIHGVAVTNDNYLLQHTAVNLFLIFYKVFYGKYPLAKSVESGKNIKVY